jgi:signal transduction histidine kinase
MLMPKGNAFIVFVLVPLLLAGFAWLLCAPLRQVDAELFSRVLVASQTPPHRLGPAIDPVPAQAFLVALACASGFGAGVRLTKVARIFVWVQLFVFLLLLQCLLSYALGLLGHPLAYTVALTLGFVGGYAVRLLLNREREYEARYYELVLKNRELQETRLQIVKQDEIERRTLAADLHDQVLNDLKTLSSKIGQYAKQPSTEAAGELEQLVMDAIIDVKDVMDSLCPSVLEHIGFVAAVEDCLRRAGQRAGLKIRFMGAVDDRSLQCLSNVELSLLYRLVQEAVTNACKHAEAAQVRGAVVLQEQYLKITISDDGKGLDLALLNGDSRGLRFMRQRADLIGATIAWQSGAGQPGTTVEIAISLAGRADGARSDH